MIIKHGHLIPDFISLTDACNEIRLASSNPDFSLDALILLMKQHHMPFNFFVLGWDINVDVAIFPIEFRQAQENRIISHEELSEIYRKWHHDNLASISKLSNYVTSWVNDNSSSGLIAEIFPTSVSVGLPWFLIEVSNICDFYWHDGSLLDIKKYAEIEAKNLNIPEHEINVAGIEMLGYESESALLTTPRYLDEENHEGWVKLDKEQTYISKENLLKIIKNDFSETKYENNAIDLQLNKKPSGVSLAKRAAQAAAKTLATYLWQQDKAQIIKIKEMAISVYAALNQTEHANQLPDKSESLKDWIKDVAPEYARQAGSPQFS